MSNIQVSVIIPVYNVKQYLKECLDSVLSQSLDRIEIIIVDDCSTDGSLQICKEYAEKHTDKIKLYCHEQNLGLPSARNTGIKHATGEYIGFVDSDDYVGPDRFRSMYENGIKSDADIVLCGPLPGCEHVRIREGLYIDPQYSDNILGKFIVYIDSDGLLRNFSVNVPRRLFRRSFLEQYRIGFLDKLHTSEDRLFSYESHFFAQSLVYFVVNERERYFYRQRTGSITHTYRPDDWKMRQTIINNLISMLRSNQSMAERVQIYEQKIPVLVFMFSLWSIRNEYAGHRSRRERLEKISSILSDPFCDYYKNKLDEALLCDEYKKYYNWMCKGKAKALDRYILFRHTRIGKLVQRLHLGNA